MSWGLFVFWMIKNLSARKNTGSTTSPANKFYTRLLGLEPGEEQLARRMESFPYYPFKKDGDSGN